MKRTPFLFIAALLAFVFIACSETDNSATEYPNWQAANEAHFDSIYNQAKADSATDKTWKILNHWSYNASVATHSYDKVVVKVVKAGTGTAATPFYTDWSANRSVAHACGRRVDGLRPLSARLRQCCG